MNPHLIVFGAGLLAGIMNALAGGGTFVTLPALISVGLPSVQANASSTVGLFPGTAASAWAYREGLGPIGTIALRPMLFTTIVGGAVGALLLLWTPSRTFDFLLPWLLLIATVTLGFGRQLGEWLRRRIHLHRRAGGSLARDLGNAGGRDHRGLLRRACRPSRSAAGGSCRNLVGRARDDIDVLRSGLCLAVAMSGDDIAFGELVRRRQAAVADGDFADGQGLADSRQMSMVSAQLDLDAALARLPADARLCVVLAYSEGMSHAEISDSTAMPLGTVKSHIARGAARLRELLHGYGDALTVAAVIAGAGPCPCSRRRGYCFARALRL
jgi:hypothetical protein